MENVSVILDSLDIFVRVLPIDVQGTAPRIQKDYV